MSEFTLDFIAAGGNRHPAAADWKPGLLAFGSGNNIALWDPENCGSEGIYALLSGHTDVVNAVKIFDSPSGRRIISGGVDKTVRIWERGADGLWKQIQCLDGHKGSVIAVATLEECGLVVTGTFPGTLRVWDVAHSNAELLQEIELKPSFLPLACALYRLPTGDIVLAVSGTSTFIQLFARPKDEAAFRLQATLTGHEGWIRSLDFTPEGPGGNKDVLLASASHDKYIRVWRLRRHANQNAALSNGTAGDLIAPANKSLENKAHQVGSKEHKFNVTFEALLIGHEDWIYSARWAPVQFDQTSPTLLSASADNSLALWRADSTSGVWICETRLGDISSQKGSTTATGSTGGFWVGLWQPGGQGVASLGRTGSWRRWRYDSSSDAWEQQIAVSGHTQEVRDLAWAKDGSYLLSTGADQTTRLFAEWKREGKKSWHEMSRPQIHGYDLNCIDCLAPNQFISGADEKLLRVFNKPGAIDQLLSNLSGTPRSHTNGAQPEAANIPVLGLSNKAIASTPEDNRAINGHDHAPPSDPPTSAKSPLDLPHPPLEDHLSRHTLWPEIEKLYGHGYEISAVAANSVGTLAATACKASALEHAVIRLYSSKDWREIKPPLAAHSLTVTSLAFSGDDRFLLSVGRDRSVAVFRREGEVYMRLWVGERAHARMILDCAWIPGVSEAGGVFATAGRDKLVKMWEMRENGAVGVLSISAAAAVTAVACARDLGPETCRVAYGTEDGGVHIVTVRMAGWEIVEDVTLASHLRPSGAVSVLRWRPVQSKIEGNGEEDTTPSQLAIGSDDSSVRILAIA